MTIKVKDIKNGKFSLDENQKILQVHLYIPGGFINTNGSDSGARSFMKILDSLNFTYTTAKGKTVKSGRVDTVYGLKGTKGALRHKVLDLCVAKNIEVCSPSAKTETKSYSVLPEGFHANGACVKTEDIDECIVHSIFGSLGHRSIIKVSAPPLIKVTQKILKDNLERVKFDIPVLINDLIIRFENHHAEAKDGRTIQQYSEPYVSGRVYFEIDVTHLDPAQLGLIITASSMIREFGGKKSSGSGQVAEIKLSLLKRVAHNPYRTDENGDYVFPKNLYTDTRINEEFLPAVEAWHKFTDADMSVVISDKSPVEA